FSVQFSNTQFAFWRSDGTAQGTYKLADYFTTLNEGFSGPVQVGNDIYFTAHEAQSDTTLWRTDGTIQGTVPVLTNTIVNWQILGLASFDGNLYFTALVPNNPNYTVRDTELLRTDGTDQGTTVISSFGYLSTDVYSWGS